MATEGVRVRTAVHPADVVLVAADGYKATITIKQAPDQRVPRKAGTHEHP